MIGCLLVSVHEFTLLQIGQITEMLFFVLAVPLLLFEVGGAGLGGIIYMGGCPIMGPCGVIIGGGAMAM